MYSLKLLNFKPAVKRQCEIDQFDAEKIKRIARQRQREQAEKMREKGLDEKSVRVTFMTPYQIICDSCKRHIPARLKLYVNVSEAPEKYLGRVKVHQALMRCPMPACNNRLKFLVNPKTLGYELKSGGTPVGVPSEEELIARRKEFEDMRENRASNSKFGAANNNNSENNKTAEELASFEDIQQMILEQSNKLDTLGDNYIDEKAQVEKIREARRRQREEDKDSENAADAVENAELLEQFHAERRKMSSLMKEGEKLATFGEKDEDDENNEDADAENTKEAKTKNASTISFAQKAQIVQQKFDSAVVDALALFKTFETSSSTSTTTQPQQQNHEDTNSNQNKKKPNNSGGSLLSSMFGDDDE